MAAHQITQPIVLWISLQPTMSLRSEIISVQHLEPNESVGYGSNFVAEQPMTIELWLVAMPMVINVFRQQVLRF